MGGGVGMVVEAWAAFLEMSARRIWMGITSNGLHSLVWMWKSGTRLPYCYLPIPYPYFAACRLQVLQYLPPCTSVSAVEFLN